MRHTVCAAALVLCAYVALGQENSVGDVFLGASYLNVGLQKGSGTVGAEIAFAINKNKWLAGELDLSGYYRIDTFFIPGFVDERVASYIGGAMIGPRFKFRPLFTHALVGVATTGSTVGGGVTSFASAIGVGAQWDFSRHLGVRASLDYVPTLQSGFWISNGRASVGLVYRWPSSSNLPAPVPRATTPIPQLGLEASTRDSGGAEIVEVAPGSVTELASLRVGDVINAVDGKPIRTAMELAAELSNRAPGAKIRLGYIRGYWQSETVIMLK